MPVVMKRMKKMSKSEKKERKKVVVETLKRYLNEYKRIIVVSAMNVNATQLLRIRNGLAGRAVVVFGKNKIMKLAFKDVARGNKGLEELERDYIKNGAGLIFTNGSFKDVKNVIDENCVGSPAKAGTIAPDDVWIRPTQTNLSPNDIKILHALNIQCKIFKGTIEITGEKQLVFKDQKVGASEANILSLLGIMPFKYTLKVERLYDNGQTLPSDILGIDDTVLSEKFSFALRRVAGLSIACGLPNAASGPHIVGNAFRDVAAVAVAIKHDMRQIADVQKLLSDPAALAAARAAATAGTGAGAGAAAAPAEEAEPEESQALDLGGLFDDF